MAAESSANDFAPPHAVRCLKREGGRSVWLIQRPGEGPRTLKIWPLTPMMLVKLGLCVAPPQRQWRGARRLERAGIPTPRVVCNSAIRFYHRHPIVILELEYVTGVPLDEIIRHRPQNSGLDFSARCMILGLSALVDRLVARRVFHRDLKPSNIIVSDVGVNADVQMWLIDTAGARRMRRVERETARLLLALDRTLRNPASRLPQRDREFARRTVLRAAMRSLSKRDRRRLLKEIRHHAVG